MRDQFIQSLEHYKLEPTTPKQKKVAMSNNIDIRHEVSSDLAPPEDRVPPAAPPDHTPTQADIADSIDAYQEMLHQQGIIDTVYSPVTENRSLQIVGSVLPDITDSEVETTDVNLPDEGINPVISNARNPVVISPGLRTIPQEILNRPLFTQPTTPLPSGQFYLHVDGGCTDYIVKRARMSPASLIDCSQAGLTAGTASGNPQANGSIRTIGFLPLWLKTKHETSKFIAVSNCMDVQGFPRESFSLAHMRRLGYRVHHYFGECVHIMTPGGREYQIPVINTGEQDYIIGYTNNPYSTATTHKPDLQRESSHKVVTSVALVNLATSLNDPGLFYLWHLRLGCIGPDQKH